MSGNDGNVPLTTAAFLEVPFAPPDHEFAYGEGKEQFAHLYLPKKTEGVPVVVHGSLDTIVPPDFSKNHVQEAKERGDTASLVVLANAGHFELVAPASSVWSQVVSCFLT